MRAFPRSRGIASESFRTTLNSLARRALPRLLAAALLCGTAACTLETFGLGASKVAIDAGAPETTGPSGLPPSPSGEAGAIDSSDASDEASPPPALDAAPPPSDDAGSAPPVGPILTVDGAADDASGADACDLDRDGHRAIGDCGGDDCCDHDARAFPGEPTFYETADACGSFDYDCNNHADPQFPVGACHLGLLSCSGDGFQTAEPPCGTSATFITCNLAILTCTQAQSQRIEACK